MSVHLQEYINVHNIYKSTLMSGHLHKYTDVCTFTRKHWCLYIYKKTLMYVHLQENIDVHHIICVYWVHWYFEYTDVYFEIIFFWGLGFMLHQH